MRSSQSNRSYRPAASSVRYRTGSEQIPTLKAVSKSWKYSCDVATAVGSISTVFPVSRLKWVLGVCRGRHLQKLLMKAGLRMAVALLRCDGVRWRNLRDRKMVNKTMQACHRGIGLHHSC